MLMESIANLADGELLAQVKRIAESERRTTAVLVAHLAEIEKRELYVEEGFRSLFTYCTQVLHFSEHAAYNRIEAARAVIRFPVILGRLARGDVHLTTVKLLSPFLTPENHRALLEAAKHKSKRDILEMIARLHPQADVPAAVRKLPASRAAGASAAKSDSLLEASAVAQAQGATDGTPMVQVPTGVEAVAEAVRVDAAGDSAPSAALPAAAKPIPRPAVVVPLAPERYKIQFTASAATCDKLRRAQDLLRHQIPNGDLAEVFDRALDLLVRDLEKKKFAATDRPRNGGRRSGKRSRYIPAAVRRAVWQRDGGRCAFVSPNGRRCTERGQLEFDHAWPHGDGGPATRDNVRLHCARHNRFQAEQFFGLWTADGVREAAAPYGLPGGMFARRRGTGGPSRPARAWLGV